MKTIHIKLILFLAFWPLCCLAQSSELKMMSDSIFEHAVQLYHHLEYQAAIQEFQKCDAIDEQYMDPVLNRREYVRNWVSRCYYMLGDEEQAKTLSNYYKIEPVDRKLTEISDSLAIIAFQYSMNADYANALQYGFECLKQEILMIGESNYTAANSYYFIADCYAGLNDYENAISYCKKSLSIRQQVLGDQSIDYLSSLYSLTIIYDLTNETDSTIKYGTQAKELYSRLIGTNDAQYCDLLENLYYSYINRNDTSKAIQIGEELTLLIKDLKGVNSEDYYYTMNSLANQYLDIDNSRVLSIREELLPIIETLYGKESDECFFNLEVLSQLYYEAKDFTHCAIYGEEFLKHHNVDSINSNTVLRILVNVALSYNMLNDYHKAIPHLQKINEFLCDTSAVYIGLLASCYELDNNHKQATFWMEKYIDVLQKKNYNSEEFYEALDILSSIYERSGNYKKALEYQNTIITYIEEKNYDNLIDKASSLRNLGYIYYRLGYCAKAVQYGEKALEVLRKCLDNQNDSTYSFYLDNLAQFYREAGHYNKAMSTELDAIQLLENKYGTAHPMIATLYNNFATINQEIGEYEVALNYSKRVLDMRESQMYTNAIGYDIALNNYAWLLYLKGDYLKARELYEKTLCVHQDTIDFNNSDYSKILTNYATLLMDIGDYKLAKIYYEKSLAMTKQSLGLLSKDCANSMNSMASYYMDLGDYKTALQYSDSALHILKEVVGEIHPSYANALSILALVQARSGDYTDAIYNTERACEIRRQLYGTDGFYYISGLGNLAVYYSEIGDVQNALKINLLVEEALRKTLGENHPDYLSVLINIAVNYSHLGNITKAIELSEKVLDLQQTGLGACHQSCANTMCNLASFYEKNREYNKAIEYAERALICYQEIYGEEHPDVAWCLSVLAQLYLYNNELQKSLSYSNRALEIRRKIFGENNYKYFLSLKDVARDYFFLEDYVSAWQYQNLCCSNLKQYFCDNLYEFNSYSRESFWNHNSYIFDSDAPFYCFYAPEYLQYPAFLYDYSALFPKGLLLNMELSLRDQILESNDSTTIRKYDEIQQNKNIINRLYELPLNERFIDVDSLEKEVRKQENELLRTSKTYGDYTRSLNVKWTDVQFNLGDKDLAVEFLSFRAKNDSVMYIALTLDKDDSIPMMIPLFEKKQLDSISNNDYYQTEALYNLIWKPLLQELEGKENVYFSPAGALHNIGIEYLPIDSTLNIADKYNLIRLSSTRELVVRHETKAPTKAVLYGGLLYNIDPELIQEDNQANNYGPRYALMMRGLEDSLCTRSDFSSLGYTLREVESINELLTNELLTTKLFTKYNGTEESFKSLDGQGINILHLATHGAYIPDQDAAKKKDEKNYRFIRLDDDNSKSVIEDQSLTRSFLVMSGGNMLIHGDSIPEGLDDGILTAQEISRLDLRGLDLVVLSACETALGDITSEGVMGLQRGFKKAGAQTIVMSLWKVADEQTMQFMTEFYRLLSLGSGKRQAFKGAQQYLREAYPEQSEKPFWSAFIMLD